MSAFNAGEGRDMIYTGTPFTVGVIVHILSHIMVGNMWGNKKKKITWGVCKIEDRLETGAPLCA